MTWYALRVYDVISINVYTRQITMDGLEAYKEWEDIVADPALLGQAMQGWRLEMGLTVKGAAELIGISWRTLEGIEQGRGFRYPKMLMHCLIAIDNDSKAAGGKN